MHFPIPDTGTGSGIPDHLFLRFSPSMYQCIKVPLPHRGSGRYSARPVSSWTTAVPQRRTSRNFLFCMPQPSNFGLSAEKYTALPPGFLQEGSADKLRWMVQTARTTPGSKILLSGKTVPEPEVTPVISFLTAS